MKYHNLLLFLFSSFFIQSCTTYNDVTFSLSEQLEKFNSKYENFSLMLINAKEKEGKYELQIAIDKPTHHHIQYIEIISQYLITIVFKLEEVDEIIISYWLLENNTKLEKDYIYSKEKIKRLSEKFDDFNKKVAELCFKYFSKDTPFILDSLLLNIIPKKFPYDNNILYYVFIEILFDDNIKEQLNKEKGISFIDILKPLKNIHITDETVTAREEEKEISIFIENLITLFIEKQEDEIR